MFNDKKVLCIIPARGGSKGIPRKNLQKIGGRTLLEWALEVAVRTKEIDRVVVTSDSQEIIDVANRHGQYAPFVRPEELARDNTPSLPVMQHAMTWADDVDSCRYDLAVLLEPPCPFRLPAHVIQGLELAVLSEATSVMSLVRVSDAHPVRIKKLLADGAVEPFCIPEPEGLRRQDQEPAFIRNQAVYVFPRETLLSGRLYGDRPYGFEMDFDHYRVNIDEPVDLAAALYTYDQVKASGMLHLIDATAESV